VAAQEDRARPTGDAAGASTSTAATASTSTTEATLMIPPSRLVQADHVIE
jgi:hypothetical protein